MSDISSAHLTAWIRFIPEGDGYGVPLFSVGGNHLLVPRTDDTLCIQSFEGFYNEDGFPISYELPEAVLGRTYTVKDKVPIPFVIGGKSDIIDTDIGLDELDQRLGAGTHSDTAALLREVLIEARSSLLRHTFVGRDLELEQLTQIWKRVQEKPRSFETIFIVKENAISLSQAPRDDAPVIGVLLGLDRVEQIGDPESPGWVKVSRLPDRTLTGFLPLRALQPESPPSPDIDAEQFYAAAALTARVSAVDDEYLFGLAAALSGLKNIPSSVAGSDGFGPFQFSIARWADLVGRFGADEDITVDARSDPFAQIVIAARYIRLLTDSLKTALRRDPQLNELFLGHLLGEDAAPVVLAAPSPPTSVDAASQGKPGDADVQKAVADNPQIFQNGNQTAIAHALAAAAAKLQLGLNAASQVKAKLNLPGVPTPAPIQLNSQQHDAFEQLMILREGRRNDVYTDSLGKLTVGIGHLVLASEHLNLHDRISDEQVTTLFKNDSAVALSAAQLQAIQAGISDPNFIPVLASVNRQLGTHWNTTKFPQTWGMIVAGKYEDAAKALNESLWFRQTPVRVKDFQDALRKLPAKQ